MYTFLKQKDLFQRLWRTMWKHINIVTWNYKSTVIKKAFVLFNIYLSSVDMDSKNELLLFVKQHMTSFIWSLPHVIINKWSNNVRMIHLITWFYTGLAISDDLFWMSSVQISCSELQKIVHSYSTWKVDTFSFVNVTIYKIYV